MKRVYITLDFRCNNDCIMCANTPEERRNNYRLSTEEIKNFLDKISLEEDSYVELSGGEPTIREDILEIGEYFKENFDRNLVLLTNARRLANNDFARKISKYVDRVVTAVYSSNPKKHDTITQRPGSFYGTLTGLKNMEEQGIKISVKNIPMKPNYEELPEWIEFVFNKFKDPVVFFSGLDLRGYAKQNQDKVAISYTELKPYLEETLDKSRELGKKVYFFTMPMCIFDPIYWDNYSIGMDEVSKNIEFLIPGRTSRKDKGLSVGKPSNECQECLLEPRCYWGWEGYVERYSNHEFKAIK